MLVVGDGTYEWYAPAFVRALQETGVHATLFDYSRLWTTSFEYLQRRAMAGPVLGRINAALLETATNLDPTVILLYASLPVYPDAVQALRDRAWVTTYHNDNPFGQYGSRACFRLFKQCLAVADSHHVYRASNMDDYHRQGYRRVALLRSYFLPWLHRPGAAVRTKEIDIVFVGHPALDGRGDYLRELWTRGFDVRLFGGGRPWDWARSLGVRAAIEHGPIRPVFGDNYRDVIARAKICLAFFSRANRDQYTRRVFEIPAMGGFLLAPRTVEMQALYEENVEAVFFDSPEELVDKCQYYLANEDARNAIARRGYARCHSAGYDVHARARQWMADVNAWMHESEPTALSVTTRPSRDK